MVERGGAHALEVFGGKAELGEDILMGNGFALFVGHDFSILTQTRRKLLTRLEPPR
jgi:hypothetical protein